MSDPSPAKGPEVDPELQGSPITDAAEEPHQPTSHWSPDSEPAPPQVDRLSFTGDGVEYFRIWVVNVALTVLTLGVFSAWAKVRRLQYFYRHTRLADASFDYHGEPLAILKGRIVGAGLFGLYTFAGVISPVFAIVVAAAIGVVMPWLLSRSLRFRLHNSSYRGLRFRFSGSTREAYWVFLALPVLTVLSLFTVGPLWHHRLKRYQYDLSSYGQTSFRFATPLGDFYRVYLGALGLGLLFLTIAVGAFAGIAVGALVLQRVTGLSPDDVRTDPRMVVLMITLGGIAMATYLGGIFTVQAFVTGHLWNAVWNHTTLGPHGFGGSVRTRSLLFTVVTNLVGTVCTLGLFWPFAQVRLARYFAGNFWMERRGSLDAFVADATPGPNAIGEEVAEIFDVDIAF